MSDIHMDPDVVSALREMMEGGFADLLDTFLCDSQERLDQLKCAHLPSDLTLVAHSFKGSSSNMGASRLAALSRPAWAGNLRPRAKSRTCHRHSA